jgi:hypothetical protein
MAWKSAARAHERRLDKATGSQSEIPISVPFGGQLPLCLLNPWTRPALVGKRCPARCKHWMELCPRKCAADLRTDEVLSLVVIRQLQTEQTCYTCRLTYRGTSEALSMFFRQSDGTKTGPLGSSPENRVARKVIGGRALPVSSTRSRSRYASASVCDG